MNKSEFLKDLEVYLQRMSINERNKFVNYYDEMISDYVENGMSEAQAVSKIGSPKNIAAELLENYDTATINFPSIGNKSINTVLTILGFPLWGSILLTVILSVFSLYALIWCLPFATGAGCVGFLIEAIFGIFGTPFALAKDIPFGLIQFGTSVASVGIGFLLGFTTIYLSKRFVVTTKKLNEKLKIFLKKKVVIK